MATEKEEMLLEELRQNGVKIENINDLIKIDKTFKPFVPILLKYIEKEMEDEDDKEWVARSLGVKGFTNASETLIKEFVNSDNNFYRWAIGNSLSIIQDKNVLPQMIEIVKDKKYGTSRQMIVYELWKFKTQEVKETLISLLDDEDVQGHAVHALSRMRDRNLIKYIEPFKEHKMTWIRNKAKKGVIRLEKYSKN